MQQGSALHNVERPLPAGRGFLSRRTYHVQYVSMFDYGMIRKPHTINIDMCTVRALYLVDYLAIDVGIARH